MDLKLRNKVILIAGESGPLGSAVIQALAAEGAIPCLVGNWNGTLEEGAPGVSGPVAIRKNLKGKEDCQEVLKDIMHRLGGIDALIYISPQLGLRSLNEESTDQFEAALKEDLLPFFLLTQVILPSLKERKGVILNIFPAGREDDMPDISGFSGIAGGYAAFVREWAVELLPFGIRVNALVLASARSGRAAGNDPGIGHTAAFLVSSRSSHTTGQLVYVDHKRTGSAIQQQ